MAAAQAGSSHPSVAVPAAAQPVRATHQLQWSMHAAFIRKAVQACGAAATGAHSPGRPMLLSALQAMPGMVQPGECRTERRRLARGQCRAGSTATSRPNSSQPQTAHLPGLPTLSELQEQLQACIDGGCAPSSHLVQDCNTIFQARNGPHLRWRSLAAMVQLAETAGAQLEQATYTCLWQTALQVMVHTHMRAGLTSCPCCRVCCRRAGCQRQCSNSAGGLQCGACPRSTNTLPLSASCSGCATAMGSQCASWPSSSGRSCTRHTGRAWTHALSDQARALMPCTQQLLLPHAFAALPVPGACCPRCLLCHLPGGEP
jgi:hypothetical protein